MLVRTLLRTVCIRFRRHWQCRTLTYILLLNIVAVDSQIGNDGVIIVPYLLLNIVAVDSDPIRSVLCCGHINIIVLSIYPPSPIIWINDFYSFYIHFFHQQKPSMLSMPCTRHGIHYSHYSYFLIVFWHLMVFTFPDILYLLRI